MSGVISKFLRNNSRNYIGLCQFARFHGLAQDIQPEFPKDPLQLAFQFLGGP